MAELSTKPYLIRAIFEWCKDCARGHVGHTAASEAGARQSAAWMERNG